MIMAPRMSTVSEKLFTILNFQVAKKNSENNLNPPIAAMWNKMKMNWKEINKGKK